LRLGNCKRPINTGEGYEEEEDDWDVKLVATPFEDSDMPNSVWDDIYPRGGIGPPESIEK
jgi:hypothetical protein